MTLRLRLGLLSLTALGLLAAPALADSPTDFIRAILTRVIAIQNDPALAGPVHEPARAKAIHQVIERSFDFPQMARKSLGVTYGRLSAGQRAEFTQIFSYLFQDSYTRLVLNFLKRETVQYRQEIRQDQGVRVNTILMRPNETIPVDYLLCSHRQGWLLYDVIVDGVSILDNYQRKFARIIQTHSFDHLLKQMRIQYQAVRSPR
jgi:phospholipid transport system substrate-binding protein